MDGMEEKLGSILGNPEMMQKIMSMAQALNASPPPEKKPEAPAPLPEIDPGMLQSISGFAKQSSIDKDQQTLLRALRPYLSRQRLNKLENAMRAAKMASFASVALNRQGHK